MAESLAVDGGKKTIREPLPGWPHYTEEAIRCATIPLRENAPNYWTNRKGQAQGRQGRLARDGV